MQWLLPPSSHSGSGSSFTHSGKRRLFLPPTMRTCGEPAPRLLFPLRSGGGDGELHTSTSNKLCKIHALMIGNKDGAAYRVAASPVEVELWAATMAGQQLRAADMAGDEQQAATMAR
ncbi:unnamed protein product [Urochloa humidicola]